MKFSKYAIGLLFAVLIAGCVGDSQPDEINADLELQVFAYINEMPGLIDPSIPVKPCESFIAGFSIRSKSNALSPRLTARTVSLQKGAETVWDGVVSINETGQFRTITSQSDWSGSIGMVDGQLPPGTREEMVLRGVARGCPGDFSGGDQVQMTVHLVDGEKRLRVQTNTRIFVAS